VELLRNIRYTTNNAEFQRLYSSKLFHAFTNLSGADDDESGQIMEVEMNKRSVKIGKPTQIGCAILANSKLQVIRFIHFLHKYLRDSAWEIMASDTDSGKLQLHS